MTKNKATKVAEKFNALYFSDYEDIASSKLQPAVIEEDCEGDFDVVIYNNACILSFVAIRCAMKVCTMCRLMMFVYVNFTQSKIIIHS